MSIQIDMFFCFGLKILSGFNLCRITDANEKCGELDILLGRLKDLAKAHADLEKKLVALQGEVNRQFDITKMSQQIGQFFLNLNSIFEKATTIEEKKDLLKRCISEIVIDRSSNVARILLRKIPAITFEIEEMEMPLDENPQN